MLISPAFVIQDEILSELIQELNDYHLLDGDMVELSNALLNSLEEQSKDKSLEEKLAINHLINFCITSNNQFKYIRIDW